MPKKKLGNPGKYHEHAGGINPNDWRIAIHEKPKTTKPDRHKNKHRPIVEGEPTNTSSSGRSERQKKKKKEDNGTLPRLYKDIIRERDSQSVHFRQSRRRNKKIYMCRNVSLLIILYFAFYLYDIFHNVNSERYKAMQTLQNIKAQDELFLQTNSTANTTGTANNDNNSTAVNAVIPHDLASMEPIVVTERSQFVSKAVLVDPSKLKRIRKYNPDGSHQTQNITHMVTPDYSNMMITVSKNTAYFTNKSAAALELALGAATVEEEENTATLEENTVTLDLTTITTVTTTAETDTSESTEGAAVSVGLKPLS